MPPEATSTVTVPTLGTSIGTSRWKAKAATFWSVTRVTLLFATLLFATSAWIRMRPPGASSPNSVTGSCIGIVPVSSRTVATHIVLLPDIGGYSMGSMTT